MSNELRYSVKLPLYLLLLELVLFLAAWGIQCLAWIDFVSDQSATKDSEFTHIHWQRFNENGLLSIDTYAKQLESFHNGTSKLVEPKIQVLHHSLDGQTVNFWNINSTYAIHNSHENTIVFHEKVYMERHENGEISNKIWTEVMQINLDTELATTDAWTTIWRPTGTVKSHGVTINLKENTIKFHERVTGTYKAQPKKK